METHEKKPAVEENTGSSEPSRKNVLGAHIFEILSSLAVIVCLGIAAAAHNKLYDEGINYDSSRFRTNEHNSSSQNQTGYDESSGVLYWMTLGLVVSCVGFFVSLLFCLDRGFKFPLLQAIISFILCAGFTVYIVYGALNTPYQYKCYELNEESWITNKVDGYSAVQMAQRNRCAAPKAAEFFAFCATFSYAYSTNIGFRTWLNRKRYPEMSVV